MAKEECASSEMTDVHTKAQRSYNMSRIRGKDTVPEMIVRRLLHRMGYRCRLHRSDLPGKPDIVLPKSRKIIFVHGIAIMEVSILILRLIQGVFSIVINRIGTIEVLEV